MAKKSIKERIKEAQAKTRAGMKRARAGVAGMKPMAVAAGAGVAGDMVAEMVGDRIDLVGKNWYGEPALMLLGALVVAKKSKTAALGLAGAAGAKARFNYALNSFQQGNRQTSPVRVFEQKGGAPGGQLPAGGGNAQALMDADMLYGDAAALQEVEAA